MIVLTFLFLAFSLSRLPLLQLTLLVNSDLPITEESLKNVFSPPASAVWQTMISSLFEWEMESLFATVSIDLIFRLWSSSFIPLLSELQRRFFEEFGGEPLIQDP